MLKRSVQIYDTTLRDGSQSEGISLSVNDKITISRKLDELGIHYIEGGWPGSNPKDLQFFREASKLRLKYAQIVAFGSTRRPHSRVSDDANLRAFLEARTKIVTLFGKSWDLHVRGVFNTSLDENLKMIFDSVKYLRSKEKEVIYDAEHFFDGYIANPEYALKSCQAALDAGARIIILCDTNGGTLTSRVSSIVREVKSQLGCSLGIHTHNDSGLAVANAVAAVEEGADQVQGTINGLGERCGNSDLVPVVANLELKLGLHCLPPGKLKELTLAAHFVSEVCNMVQQKNQPYAGQSAFAHKGGVHINAVMKETRTYEHIDPTLVGNERRFLTSELSGRSHILVKASKMNLNLKKEDPRTKRILQLLQEMEHEGYQFEAADASFELLMKKSLKRFKNHFELLGFRVIVEKDEKGVIASEATVKVKVKQSVEHTAALGDGPVNALDNALRKALTHFYPSLAKMHLADFKVRVLNQKAGTAARVRVLIQSQDDKDSWTTVGVSENIIEASWQALADSVEYKIMKDQSSH